VAEACSGVKFLVAMIALGTLVAHLCFRSSKRRAVFMAACAIVPVLANGVRAWGTIYVAQSRGVEFAAGFDHIVYGWFFFAFVMMTLLAISWRYFDRAANDDFIDAEALVASPRLTRLADRRIDGWWALVLLLAVIGAIWAATLATGLAATGLHP
jgi:exosortase/archaeosortase family protein